MKVTMNESSGGSQALCLALKRTVQDMKREIAGKDEEVASMRRNIKLTKLNQLSIELNTYKQECIRLRGIAESAVSCQVS